MLALKIKARKYNPPIKRTPFAHVAFVQLLALFFRVLLLCKVVLLNKCSKIIGSCFLSGIVVLGRRLSATSLYLLFKSDVFCNGFFINRRRNFIKHLPSIIR